MKKFKFLLFFTMIAVGVANAQVKVTGTVISSEDNLPIIGASIIVKGTTIGTVTDFDGNFSLEVEKEGAHMVFSYVGMAVQEHKAKTSMNITLNPSSEMLEELVVTGYGVVKKASFTGSASVVSTEKVKDVPTLGVQSRLAGAVAGVQIGSTSGQPGAVESVRIRGMGSINAGNDPLYVIDGVPMTTGNASGFGYSQSGNSILSTINSNDIESMTVIKDAAAASLYGSRAANGVIVITTKQGKSGKTKFNLKTDWGMSNMAVDYRPILDGDARRELQYMGYKNYFLNAAYSEENAIAKADANIDSYASKPWSGWTNWKDVLFQNGLHQNYELSAQGGNEKTQFFSSLSYTDQQGITLQSAYERFTGRANITHRTDRLTLNTNLMFARSSQNVNTEGTGYASPVMAIGMSTSPSSYPYNEDGTFNETSFHAMGGRANPLQSATYNYDRSNITRFNGAVSALYNIWDNLNIKEVLSYDFHNTNNNVWWDSRTNDGRSSNGSAQRYMMNRSKLVSQTQLMYAKRFAEKHNIDALAAYEIEDYILDYTYASGSTFPNASLTEITNASNTRAASKVSTSRLISYVARLNYDYESRYFLGASFRRDGTSRLSSESRWGDFWSVSGSWRISDEEFMLPLADVLSDAKIRASYGVNGTQPTDYYGYMGIYGAGANYNGNPGYSQSRLENPNLKWEKNYATNIGVEFSLLHRFFVNFDWYNRDTKDLLMDKPISQTTGFTSYLMNVGAMRNRGVELELRSENIRKKDFTWSTSLNISHNNNTLQKLDGSQQEIISGNLIYKVGQPYYSFYVYEYAGVDSKTGKELYYKNKGENPRETTTNITEADRTIVGSAQAKVQGGLVNNVSYKNFDFGLTLTYSLGGKCYDDAVWLHSNGGTYNYLGNIPSYYDISKVWQKEGDNAVLPKFVYGSTAVESSRWMLSTDHLRVKNVTLGYTAPKKLVSKLKVDNIRAFASASNLLTWRAKDSYLDPEVPSDGLVTFETPSLRTITFGIEIGF
ncbi:MAG: TonB-dependent receptor [Bacteroidales bacterium]|nr:TonB-dependent receptor [Bacteroidales bacterium]